MHQPSPDITATLRAILPPDLHHLVEPIARYIEAAAELRDLAQDPASSKLIAQALAALSGKDVPLTNGVISFGTGNSLGDVAVRDVAGHDIVHLTINLGLPLFPVRQVPLLNADQLRVLLRLNEVTSKSDNRTIIFPGMAEEFGWETRRLRDAVKLLYEKGFLERLTLFQQDAANIALSPKGRQYLRDLEENGGAS